MAKTILHIDSSPFGDRSFSRKLGTRILEGLKAKHPDARVVTRDLAATPLPHLDGNVLGAFFTAPDQRNAAQNAALKASDQAVQEVLEADIIVIGAPMWNFGIPSVLKAWIDHIVRAGLTFKYTATGPVGLVPSGKKVIIASSRGGVYSEGPYMAADHQESHLKAVLGFLGLTDVVVVRTEGVNMGDESVKKALQSAETQLADALKHAA